MTDINQLGRLDPKKVLDLVLKRDEEIEELKIKNRKLERKVSDLKRALTFQKRKYTR